MWRWCCCISSTAQWKCTPELICIIKGIQTYLGPVGLYMIFLSAPDRLCSDRASTALELWGDTDHLVRGGLQPSGQRRSHNWPKNFYYFDWSGVHSLMPKINSKNSEFLYHIVFLAVWWRLSNRIYTLMSGYNRVVWNFTEAKQKKPWKTSARLLRIFKCRLLVDFDSWPQYF